jgi:8-oxo-dGTP pyrophosphatase MutT (NUDIX family)
MIFTDASGNKYALPLGEEISWRISVYGIVFSADKSKVLMVMPEFNPQWQFPGGSVDIEETFEEALKREFIEELGYLIKIEKLLPYYYKESNFYHKSFNKFYHSIQLTFIVELEDEVQKPELIHPEDIDGKVGWIKIMDLNQKDVQHTHWPIIQMIQQSILAKPE